MRLFVRARRGLLGWCAHYEHRLRRSVLRRAVCRRGLGDDARRRMGPAPGGRALHQHATPGRLLPVFQDPVDGGRSVPTSPRGPHSTRELTRVAASVSPSTLLDVLPRAGVVPGASVDVVKPAATGEAVVSCVTVERVVPAATAHDISSAVPREVVGPATTAYEVLAAMTVHLVVATPGVNHVTPGSAVDLVAVGVAHHRRRL